MRGVRYFLRLTLAFVARFKGILIIGIIFENISSEYPLSCFNSLGSTASSEEADELFWFGADSGGSLAAQTLGTKDEDHRTMYGIIIRDPKSHGSSDEVVIDIPGDQVQANVVVKGTTLSDVRVESASTA